MNASSLRIAIRAFLENAPANIHEIIDAFPGYSVHKIQRAVYSLVSTGDAYSTGERRGAEYSVKPLGRLAQAAAHRQAALDYINANPGVTSTKIIKALNWPAAAGADRLATMCGGAKNRGQAELSREPVVLMARNSCGYVVPVNTYSYTALTTKTKGADKVSRDVTANFKAEKCQPKPASANEPWRTVHIGGLREDLKNQRGQGAVRHSVRRGCSLG